MKRQIDSPHPSPVEAPTADLGPERTPRKGLRENASGSRRRQFGPGRASFLLKKDTRASHVANIWYHYSGRLRTDVLIAGNQNFLHFCLLEGDESILAYELNPPPISYEHAGQLVHVQFAARVTLRSTQSELHELAANDHCSVSPRLLDTVQAAGLRHVAITPSVLRERSCLIRNWTRALAFQAAARDLALDPACNEIASFFRNEGEATLAQVLETKRRELQSFYTAAIFRCLQEGWLHSDLGAKPLSMATRVWRSGVSL